MPILVSDIILRMRNGGLDAQPDTGYYDDLDDLVPSIDSAVKWMVSVINTVRSQNKSADEAVRELTKCEIYRTSSQSRIFFEAGIWTIDAVQPLPDTASNGSPIPPPPTNIFSSLKRTDLVFVRSYYSAHRKTIEESGQNRQNPHSPGYMPIGAAPLLVEGSSLNVTFAYNASYDYNQFPAAAVGNYIEVLPEIPNKLVAVFETLNPAPVTATNQTILFPVSLFVMLYEKALQFVSYVQGDQTTIWQITGADVNNLIKAIS